MRLSILDILIPSFKIARPVANSQRQYVQPFLYPLSDRRDSKSSPSYRSSARSKLISKQIYLFICCLASLLAHSLHSPSKAGQRNIFAQIHAQPSAVQMPDQRISKSPLPNVNVSQPQCYFIFAHIAVPCRPNHDTMKEQ